MQPPFLITFRAHNHVICKLGKVLNWALWRHVKISSELLIKHIFSFSKERKDRVFEEAENKFLLVNAMIDVKMAEFEVYAKDISMVYRKAGYSREDMIMWPFLNY